MNIPFSVAPAPIALRSVVVMRGMSKPPLVLILAASTSSSAFELAGLPVVFMPMFWQKPGITIKWGSCKKRIAESRIVFFISFVLKI